MSTEKLVFNGVNGATGRYRLPPMTIDELAGYIQDASSTGRGVEEQIALRRNNADKIAALVRLLAETSLEPDERDGDWHERWIERLATTLADKLLGGEHAQGTRFEALKARLRGHTVDKLADIARYLAEDKAADLAVLLLQDQDEAPDIKGALSVRLRRDLERLDEVQRDLFAAGQSPGLAQDAAGQQAWFEKLIDSLRLVPIRAWNASTSGPMRVRPLQPLIRAVDGLAARPGSAGRWLDGLRDNLHRMEAASRAVPWDDVLDALRDGLGARAGDRDDRVEWQALCAALHGWLDEARRPLTYRGLKEGLDPLKLAEAGWGIIFAREDPRQPSRVPAIKQALAPLIDLRRTQAGTHFCLYEGPEGYRFDDTANSFLARHGATASSPADPDKVPYYLLIVGSPAEIPFHFQYQLDVQYAVGRIDFGDDLDAYASYARSVVAAEQRQPLAGPRAVFFGTANPGDRSTRLSADHLVQPLHDRLKTRYASRWQFEAVLRGEATRARLLDLAGGEQTPDLLFIACHGVEFDKDDPQHRQLGYQGALLCQEWQAPGQGEIPREAYLSGEDVRDDGHLLGSIAFLFACYSAGTPRFDAYAQRTFKASGETIADQPFTSALPKAMLSLSRGGALAVVGHVERVWSSSFLDARDNEQLVVFEGTIERLLKGQPVGWAMEYFNGQYAALSTELTAAYSPHREEPNRYRWAAMWAANNDARGYVVLGDPAVRLPVIEPEPAQGLAGAVGGRQ